MPSAHNMGHKHHNKNSSYKLEERTTTTEWRSRLSVTLPNLQCLSLKMLLCSCFSFLEISCRGERIRDYYQKQQGYAACQTTKKVSRLECRGWCAGGQCCGPLRSKRRKYSFECTDGSSFVDEVEKVVKCGCARCAS